MIVLQEVVGELRIVNKIIKALYFETVIGKVLFDQVEVLGINRKIYGINTKDGNHGSDELKNKVIMVRICS